MEPRTRALIVSLLAIALLFPLFIQVSGGIYDSATPVIDSGGMLSTLPLPVSIGACALALLVLCRSYRLAIPAVVFISALVSAMLLSLAFAGVGLHLEERKLLLAAQFLLPTMGLALGLMVRDENNVIPRAFMGVLVLLVPLQLAAGWWQQTLTLTHHLYVFSIYQHFQFVPVIFVAAFCFVLAHLWGQYKFLLQILTGAMGVYVLASASFLAIGLYAMFVSLFLLRKLCGLKLQRWKFFGLLGAGVLAAVGGAVLYYGVAKSNNNLIGDRGQYLGKFQTLAEGKIPINIEERLGDWKMYGSWIIEDQRSLLFGHVSPPAREVRTSPHNWYLDLIYNFGLVSLLPLLALIGYTTYLLCRSFGSLSEEVIWLACIVAFLVLVDSNFKVTLRQPYPGIFAYFLWGLLLSRLQAMSPPKTGY